MHESNEVPAVPQSDNPTTPATSSKWRRAARVATRIWDVFATLTRWVDLLGQFFGS